MWNVASAYSLDSSGRGTTFFSSMAFIVCVLSYVFVRRMHNKLCVCHKGFKNVPAPARQTPSTNPENYSLRFPQHKNKWVIQNSISPKVGRSFFRKKGQHVLSSIKSGLMEARSHAISFQVKACTHALGLCNICFMYFGITS